METLPPDPARQALYDRCYGAYRALYPALKPQFATLSQLAAASTA